MKKHFLKVLLCVTLAAMTASGQAQEPSVIKSAQGTQVTLPNLDMANGTASWILRYPPKQDDVYQMEKTPEGKAALSIHINANSPNNLKQFAYIARRDLPTAAGYYQLQFRAKSDMKNGSAGLHILAQQTDKSYLQILQIGQDGAPQISGKTAWTDYFVVYKIPVGITATLMQFEANNLRGSVSLANVSLEKLSDEAGRALLKQINPQAESAQDYGAKMVATPCRVVNAVGYKMIYQPPGLHHSVLVFNSCTPGEVGSAIFVDYVKGTSTVIPMPTGSGGWDIIETSPGKLLFESLSSLLSLVTIDTTNGNYKVVSDIPVPESTYAWRFAKAPDGMIYFGSYPTCHAYSYNPQTQKVTDLGLIGPEGNLYVRHVAVDDRGFLLCAVSFSKPNIVAYNLKTKEQTIVAPGQSGTLIQVGGRVYMQFDGPLQEFDATNMKFAPVTSPAPPQGLQWKVLLHSSTPQKMVILASDNKWYLCEPGKAPQAIWDLDLKGGSIIGVDSDNKVLGMRGQEYFAAAPLAKEVKFHAIAEKPVPVSIHFITADPKGGVTGGPSFGQTLFRYDATSKLEQNTGQVADGGGEVYDGKWKDGKFYYVAYSGGYLGEWDPNQPWDQIHNVNPKILQQYNSDKWGSLIRPIGGDVIGPGGKIYTGWSAEYGKAGGGLTEYDTETGKSRSWTNDIFANAMSIGKIAADKKYVYGVTSNVFSGIVPPAKPLVFWAFDPATEKVLFKQTLTSTSGALVFQVPQTGHVWLVDANGLHLFDVSQMKFTQDLKWPKEAGSPSGATSVDSQGNKAWIFAGNNILRLEDGAKPQLKVLFQVEKTGHLAAGDDGKLYYTQGSQLWAVPLEK
jgi:streptogramin lyase